MSLPATERTWTVPPDHPAFPGHFPGQPIVPGVVLLDLALQHTLDWLQSPSAAGWQIAQAKFFSPVQPGEQLVLHLSQTARGSIQAIWQAPDREIARCTLSPPATP